LSVAPSRGSPGAVYDAPSMDQLLTAVREVCPVGLWSQGVKLARADAVSGEHRTPEEVVVRVRAPGHAVAPTVRLYPGDAEWDCDCGGSVDPCAHVAAAVIALAQAQSDGRDLFGEHPAAGHVRYELRCISGGLTLERFVVDGEGHATSLTAKLTDLVARRDPSLTISPTHADLTVDRLLGRRASGEIPPDKIASLLDALEGSDDVRLDGEPIRASREPVVPRARVVDEGESVVLIFERDPRVTKVIAFGVVRCGDTLHPVGEGELSGFSLEKLPAKRVFAHRDLGELVGTVLPSLESRLPVRITSKRLPGRSSGRARDERPRIHFEVEQRDRALTVMPLLVYGDPPRARIDDGRLVHLEGDIPTRHEVAERDIIHRLRDELDLVVGRRVHFDAHDAARFLSRLRAFEEATPGEHAHPSALVAKGMLVPIVETTADAFDVRFVLEGSDGERVANATAVLRAHAEGLGLAPLEGGGFAPIPAEWVARYGHLVADLLAAREEDGRVPTVMHATLGELCDALERPRPPELERLRALFEGFEGLPAPELPADLHADLRHYQHDGVRWLAFLRDAELGGVLADDMGLGKTLQALAVMTGRALVVCPRSVVFNWEAEARRFRPGLSLCVYHGPRRSLDEAAALTLTTYATLRNDIDALADVEWDAVILDEAQAIKNPDSQSARAAYRMKARFRLSLSGTPVENRLEELWSQMHFANPGLLGGRRDFAERYARPIEEGRPDAAARLRARIAPFVLRRLKRDVAPELPPRTEMVLPCELDERERAVYDGVRAATHKEIVAALSQGGSVLAALLRLRQAACHPALVPGQTAERSSKVDALCETLVSAVADGHKALVFSQWTSLLDLVEPHLEAAGLGFTRLDGSTKDRAAVVNAFQDDAGPPVLLLSLKAGGTGLNLTAADHVFLLDPWWNPAAEDQAADRAHRIGQDRPVFVHRLVAKDTVEERILGLQEKKRALAEAALGAGEAAMSLTRDDLLALLE
jgi:superfamily II DNA or RNA helicase